jgi:zinc protease
LVVTTLALAPVTCGPRGTPASPVDQMAETETAELSEKELERRKKAKEAAEKQAMLEALPALPGVEKPRPVVFPEPVITSLENGLELIVLEDHEVPLVEASIHVKAGDIYAPADAATVAGMTASLLTEGTKKRSKAEIDGKIDATGGSMGSGAGDELASISASVLSRDLDLALSLMAEQVMIPAFVEDSLKKIKDQSVQGVRAAKSNPQALAQTLAGRIVYGESSPYGRLFPSEEKIESTTRAQIIAFHERHYVANNAILIVAGDITPKRAERLAKKHFGKWKRGDDIPIPRGEPAKKPDKVVIHIVDRKASAQAQVAVVAAAPKIGDKHWLEAKLLQTVLSGGTMSTRLNMVLREQLGLTYGAYAMTDYGHDGGSFFATGSTKTKAAVEFADALVPLVYDLAAEPLPEKQLTRIKNMVSGGFALEVEGVGVVASKTLVQRMYDLPANFWRRYRADVESITPEQLRASAATWLDRDTLQIVVVGRRKKLEKLFRDAGEIRVYNTDLERTK